MAESKVEEIKMAQANVLKVSDDGPKWGPGKSKKSHQIIFQNTEDLTEVITAVCFSDPLPEEVHAGSVLKDLTIEKEKRGDSESFRVRFGEKKGDGPQRAYGGGARISPEELNIKRFEAAGKIVGVAYSYAFDMMKDSPDVKTEGICDEGDIIAQRMWTYTKGLLGGSG